MEQPTDKPQGNPLREGISTRAVPQACSLVIFGATGDLTHRKLVPAVYNVAAGGELPPAVTTRGMKEEEMLEIADLINEALIGRDDPSTLERVRGKVRDLTRNFPLPS